jgi:hypothetical protein
LAVCLLLGAAAAALAAGDAPAGDPISADGFESGNTLAWDLRLPPLPVPDVFRFADLDLRDPHVFLDVPGFGCLDVTDDAPPGGPSVNEQLATAVTTDDDGDGLLDLSVLLGFRPFDTAAVGLRLDAGPGDCLEPIGATVCDWRIPPVPRTTSYDALSSGACVEPHSGTTSGYTPGITVPFAPCVGSAPALLPFRLFGQTFALEEGQVGAAFLPGPVSVLSDGLFLGFLTEVVADTILLPPDLPIVGGQPLSILFPGGAGNCAAGDDRDLLDGESGWWLYFNYPAEVVPFVGQ